MYHSKFWKSEVYQLKVLYLQENKSGAGTFAIRIQITPMSLVTVGFEIYFPVRVNSTFRQRSWNTVLGDYKRGQNIELGNACTFLRDII